MTGGDILEITWNNPQVSPGTGILFGKSNEDSTFDLGGFRSNDDDNMIDGGGNMIDQMNRIRPSFECTISYDMNIQTELDKLSQLASTPVQTDWTISHINGTVWKITGKPVGDLKGNGNNATIQFKIAGGKLMKKTQG